MTSKTINLSGKKIWVAGHRGLVGSAICKRLYKENAEVLTVSRNKLDLKSQKETFDWLRKNKPDYVILAAAKVGGIYANDTYPYDFIYDNLAIETNVIHASHLNDVKKLIFLGSTCIYPKYSKQPMKEEYLLSGSLEPTNEWYAVAKISGIKMCDAIRKQFNKQFIPVNPTNVYGPGDNFHLQNSHVVPALIRKFYEAKKANADEVVIWGSGRPIREFIYVDDLADAVVFILKNYNEGDLLNISSGEPQSINQLVELLVEISEFKGKIKYDSSMPDGAEEKRAEVKKLSKLGWKNITPIKEGLRKTYEWFEDNYEDIRKV